MKAGTWGSEPFSEGYKRYVLAVLMLCYVANIMDRSVLSMVLEPIRHEFQASDSQLGLLGGLAFAFFYSTFGIPIAAWADRSNRRSVLALSVGLWSVMTALCGAAGSFFWLLLARVGTAVGEAGGTPPSHSLIADYFRPNQRGTALAVFAVAIPIGGMLGAFFGGWGNQYFGWRATFVLVGLPGVLVALLVRLTVAEPTRGLTDGAGPPDAAPPFLESVGILLRCRCSGTSRCRWPAIVVYSASIWNRLFVRTHHLGTGGGHSSLLQGVGMVGTLLGGLLADALSRRSGDPRWYMWVPGIATIVGVPFQLIGYQAPSLWLVLPCLAVTTVMGASFFGPSFAVAQSLAAPRMRAVAASVLLFVQTLVGLGLGPWSVGLISDRLKPAHGEAQALAWGLLLVALVNVWATAHYFWGARSYRADLAAVRAG
jgi:predicted MFS family arabinose efflux permease